MSAAVWVGTVEAMLGPLRRRALTAVTALGLGLAAAPWAPAAGVVEAAPAGDEAVVAFVVRGVGNGHGRGLSQWGSYGRALDGQDYREILQAYYGGTQVGSRPGGAVRVRLTGWDGAGTVGVVAPDGAVVWNGTSYRSAMAVEVGPNQFDVYASPTDLGCPTQVNLVVPTTPLQRGATVSAVRDMQRVLAFLGHDPGPIDGIFGEQTEAAVRSFQTAEALPVTGVWDQPTWTLAQQRVDERNGGIAWGAPVAQAVAGPIRFGAIGGEQAAAKETLGLCSASGAITHYRGDIEVHATPSGTRVVNAVGVEAYLRGVVPRESPSYWGDGGGGAGINALKAQAVAARSYALKENRGGNAGYHGVAGTCDTASCQVYGGAGTRASATSGFRALEDHRTDRAISETAGEVRVWPGGELVLTEFSASNGPRTAGGQFPPVDDPWDDHPDNPLHRWTRIIDADRLAEAYGLTRADAVRTVVDPASPYDGIWSHAVQFGDGRSVTAWRFRNDFNLPAPGFELIPITRTTSSAGTFAYVGDSVGVGIAGADTSPLRVLLEGVHAVQHWNSRGGRPTGGGSDDGVAAAATVPEGADLVVVELGYNDTPSQMPQRIDAVMQTLRDRRAERVLWVTVSERRSNYDYAATNAAIRAAEQRWGELDVIDWHAASSNPAAKRWFAADGVHLTTTGNAEFSLFLREHILAGTARPVAAGSVYRVPVLGAAGVPEGADAGEAGVGGVALNVTAVNPAGPGWLRVWDCAAPEPDTSSVNFGAAGAIEPNAVVVPMLPESTEVCIRAKERTHVIVDVAGYFAADPPILYPAAGRVADTRGVARVPQGGVLPVRVLGQAGVPDGATAGAAGVAGVALNVTAVNTSAAGWLRVWDCAAPEPDTSSVNYMTAGAAEPNAVVVPLAADSNGEICVRSRVETDVIVDVAGWFTEALPAAGRLVDTRLSGPVTAQGVLPVRVLGRAGLPDAATAGEAQVGAVALNVTAVDTSGPGWLRVWDCAAPEPDTSSVNYTTDGAVEPNAVIVPLAADSAGEVCVRTRVGTHVVVDLAGWFGGAVLPAAGRIADTRYGIGPLPD